MAAQGGIGQAGLFVARGLEVLSHSMLHHGFVNHRLPIDYFEANLPDYDVTEMRQWMRLYFHKPTSNAYFIQSIVITVWLAFVIFAGLLVILYRLWDRTLWLFRIQETRGSSLIIPNSITAFVLFEAAYALVWVCDVWNNLAIDKWDASPTLTGFWNGTPWILLFSGAWCGAWGTFFASPGILHRSTRARGFDPRRLVPGPKMCNFVGFFAPLLFTATCLGVSIPTGLTYKHAVEQWRVWDAEAAAVAQNDAVQGALCDAAAEVWKNITDAWWWTSVGWLTLLAFAWAFLLFYVMCGGFLVFSIHSQLKAMKSQRKEALSVRGHADRVTGPDAAGPETPRWDQHNAGEIAADMEMSRAQASVFFPPLATQGTQTTGPTTRKTRIRMLSSAMTNVSFIYGSISLGTLGFVINLHWLLPVQYQQAVLGPMENNVVYEKYMAVASWVISVFGAICFTAISQKTFEGVFEEWTNNREAKKLAKAETKHSDGSATLLARNASKATSLVSMRLKSLKSTLASPTPVNSNTVSRNPSIWSPVDSSTAEPAMDPAHAQALQYFHRNRVAGLGLMAGGQGDEKAQMAELGNQVADYGYVGSSAANMQPPPTAAEGNRTSALPFSHYRLSSDNADVKTPTVAGNNSSLVPRGQALPSPTGALTPRRYGSAASGVMVQRYITSTSEDARKYAKSVEGIEGSVSSEAGLLRSKSNKEPPSPRHETRRAKFDAYQSEPLPPVPALSPSQRRQQFHQDDSIAFSDTDNVDEEEMASSCLDSQSESGSVRHPLRTSRPCSSVMAVWPHGENVNGSPTFGTAPFSSGERSPSVPGTPRSPSIPGTPRTPDAPESLDAPHRPTVHATYSQATLIGNHLFTSSADENRESLDTAVTHPRKMSLRWDTRNDCDKSPKEGGGESSSSPRRPR
ncbi:unnamed protein product [Tilletia controversa]|uniref:Uncharacterized protein n=3 Tax=Tilletia TaxID=13289 RepID=A0A8X7N0N4_9BASI|nr:hypothetical protein CF336_g102 [Tilletia laevis]KAE8255938.1 hypothetical protein A4X06_0g170 [Tilletia controversa]KAE8265086.1 hypothetical protein A4X03_0g494 [Tilletia caries]KAE8208540.1 hypothetical protein CF335_g335 [Tilletia laevis]CAD6901568.1 unnamed protein product [Tilletia caries]